MKILNWLIRMLSKTVGEWHWPWVDKGFAIEEYFEIEKLIRTFSNPLVVGLVKTKGHGSNLLISASQFFSKKKCFKITHALVHIGIYKGYKHRVVESVGDGIQLVPLLTAIGQKDNVVLRRPNPKLVNDMVCKHAIEYIHEVEKRDAEIGIEYDNDHIYDIITIEQIKDYSNKNVKLDCSETMMQALEHGFKMTGQKSLIKMINRGGKLMWAPSDIYFSELFITFYDSRKGFIDGNL